jgi:hypothetical protein
MRETFTSGSVGRAPGNRCLYPEPDPARLIVSGTSQYELYFNSDNTECLVFERYRDSQALLDHHKHLGDTMAAILQTCSGSGEICGTPSPELIEQLKDSPVQVYM